MSRNISRADRRRIRDLENQHFDAEHDLADAVLDWLTDHQDEVAADAASGCTESAGLLLAVARFFATLGALERAETDAEFRAIVGAMSAAPDEDGDSGDSGETAAGG